MHEPVSLSRSSECKKLRVGAESKEYSLRKILYFSFHKKLDSIVTARYFRALITYNPYRHVCAAGRLLNKVTKIFPENRKRQARILARYHMIKPSPCRQRKPQVETYLVQVLALSKTNQHQIPMQLFDQMQIFDWN